MSTHPMTWRQLSTLSAFIVLLLLTGCAAPITTGTVPSDIAGRCKLMAYREQPGSSPALLLFGASGLAALAINEANTSANRQEIFNSCIQVERGAL